jgi:hypothetical protein
MNSEWDVERRRLESNAAWRLLYRVARDAKRKSLLYSVGVRPTTATVLASGFAELFCGHVRNLTEETPPFSTGVRQASGCVRRRRVLGYRRGGRQGVQSEHLSSLA